MKKLHAVFFFTVRKSRFLVINKGILINGDPTSNKANIGSPLNMTCEVYNTHVVYWTKNGAQFPPSRPPGSPKLRISTYKKRMAQTHFILYLVFTRVEEEDKGNYSCVGRDALIGDIVRSYKYFEPGKTKPRAPSNIQEFSAKFPQ